MAKYTEYNNLILPDENEAYDIQVANKNNSTIDKALHEKVNKVSGKDLSTNDFTNGYKKKLDRVIDIAKGQSAYEVAVESGFEGTEEEWLESLNGVSPIIATSKIDKETTITIEDAEGTKTTTINDGEDGEPGYTPQKGIDYFTEEEITQIKNNILSAVNQFGIQAVETLPTENIDTHIIYFVPKAEAEQQDVYDEYIHINDNWEHIGTTEVDLSNYYNKTEINTKLDNIVSTSHKNTITSYTITTEEEISENTDYEIPCNYKVGQDTLDIYYMGEKLIKADPTNNIDGHYIEVGENGTVSNKIQFYNWGQSVPIGRTIEFIVRGVYENET